MGTAAAVPSTGTQTGPVVHQGHQNLLFSFVETSIGIHRPHGMEGGKAKPSPDPPARRLHSRPPCTAAGSRLLRGFFVLDNKNKTLFSGSYKNPTEKLSPAPSGVLETFLSHWPSAQPRSPGL